MGMTNSDWKNLTSAHGKAVDRIRELEAELAEALEKTDKLVLEAQRGEKVAVDKLVDLRRELAEARLDSARLDYLQRRGCITIEADVQDRFGIDLDSDEYPKHKNLRAAIDAAMKEAK